MRKVVPLVAFSVLFTALVSCSLFVSLDGLDEGDVGAIDSGSCDAGSCGEGGAPVDGAITSDAAADAYVDAGINPCRTGSGGTAGPRMIQAEGFCIDSTEVTIAQYEAFLNDGGHGVVQPAACAWNDSFAPNIDGGSGGDIRCTFANSDPSARPNHPISCIDWCDAWSYCNWAGKRLCGGIGGGPTDFGAFSNNAEWFTACASTARNTWPNDSADGGNCWIKKPGTLDVATTSCNGSYEGLSDMAGNVEEWIDSCDSDGERDGGGGPAFDRCHDEGNEFDDNTSGPGCYANDDDRRKETWSGIGFRCCSEFE